MRNKMPYLEDEIKNLNRNKRIKIRLNKIVDGYSIYLEYNKDYQREKKFLKLQISNNKIISKKDKEILYKAEIVRDKQELDLFSKTENFELQNKVTQADFFEYFDNIAKNNKLPAYSSALKQLKIFTKNLLKTSYLRFSDIDVRFCNKFKDYLVQLIEDENLANQTAKTYLSVFAAALNKAYNDKLISSNPAARVRIKLVAAKIEFLDEDELKQLVLVDTKFTEIKNSFLFASQTSLRLGDIRSLTFNDVRVNKDNEAFMYFRQNKTKNVSHLKLSKLAFDIYLEQKDKHPDSEFVFLLPVSRSDINVRLRQMAEQAGIKKYIHFHVSRHSWATLALTRNVDIYTVSKIMGHSSVAITEIYANLINKKRDEVADIINLEISQHDIDKKNKLGK
jgi:integrase